MVLSFMLHFKGANDISLKLALSRALRHRFLNVASCSKHLLKKQQEFNLYLCLFKLWGKFYSYVSKKADHIKMQLKGKCSLGVATLLHALSVVLFKSIC